jgi:hypothetical protein
MSKMLSGQRVVTVALLSLSAFISSVVLADEAQEANRRQIDKYRLTETFNLPVSGGPSDVLPDGRIVVLSNTTVFRETAPGSRNFASLGTLPDADFSEFGASFMSISPAGDRIAVGNNGGASFSNFQVGVFTLPSLSGVWFNATSSKGEWINDRFVALTAGDFGIPASVTALDTFSTDLARPSNRTIIQNIGGFSGGITFDEDNNLYTGNGFATTGPSQTGAIRAFSPSEWLSAFQGGAPVEFETQGVLIVNVLSASSMQFDRRDNLFVGGGDFFGGEDINFAALLSKNALKSALKGRGTVDTDDDRAVRKLDPDPGPTSVYSVLVNRVRDEVYLQSGSTMFVFSTR